MCNAKLVRPTSEHLGLATTMAADARAAFLSLQASLAQRRRSERSDPVADDALRHRAAEALEAAGRAGAQLTSNEVDVRLLRPPWSSTRLLTTRDFENVADARAALASRQPEAGSLLKFLDKRADPLEAYRRLGEARHLPWAEAAVAASVAAVQRARARAGNAIAPRVLVAQGSLGAEAAAAAAAGARVVVCEPNRFAQSAIRAVAAQHGFSHAIEVIESDIEAVLRRGCVKARGPWHVLVLAPLLDESALGRRLLPAAMAAMDAVDGTPRGGMTGDAPVPIVVPARVHVRGALALLTAGVIHGVDLAPLDSTRWTPHPIAWAPHREEAASRLSDYVPLFSWGLQPPARGDAADSAESMARALRNGSLDAQFMVSRALVAACNEVSGDAGGGTSARCNAVILDVLPEFEVEEAADSGVACPLVLLSSPQKRAVHFLEPFLVMAGATSTLSVRHDRHRLSVMPPQGASPAPHGPADGWGTLVLQHWHFAMVRDAPRNDAYAHAITRAANAMARNLPADQRPPSGGLGAIDMGSGSGLLALMLAKAMKRAHAAGGRPSGGPPQSPAGGHVLGVEIVAGVADLGNRVIAHNGCDDACSIIRAEGHAIMAQTAQRPLAERPRAPLLVAELMDSGGLGEGLLPLAHDAVTSGLISQTAQLLPCRLRVWAFVAELRGCGTALDACELAPAYLGGVCLEPWHAYHELKYYASIDLPAAEYTPLTPEALLFDARLGEAPPDDATLRLSACADGVANAVVWTWEADLDDSGLASAHLSNAPRAPRTHWRQAARLLNDEQRAQVASGQPLSLRFEQHTNGRELRFEVRTSEPAAKAARPPSRTRAHEPKFQSVPPTEPAADVADGVPPSVAGRGSADQRFGRSIRVQRRTIESSVPRARKQRLPAPRGHVAVDPTWKAAMKAATDGAMESLDLNPRGAVHSGRLCAAALEIGAHPARYGVHPMDALQAVRIYYAS